MVDLLERLEKGHVKKFVREIINDYYFDTTIAIIKDLKNILNRFGWQDNENNKFLIGEFYHLSTNNQTFKVNHHTDGVLIELNSHSISLDNLSCQHLKNLQSFINQAYKITCSHLIDSTN